MPCFDPLLESMTALDIAMASASSPEGVALRQRHRLSRLIDVAKRGSSWYRRSLQGICAESATLGGLPVVTRQELMQSFDAWVTDPRLNLSWSASTILAARRQLFWPVEAGNLLRAVGLGCFAFGLLLKI